MKFEKPAPPEEPAKEADFAAVRKALEILENDPEFNTFFKGYSDSAEFNLARNHREFFARYEIFQAKKETEQKLGELYVKDIEQALNLPLSKEGGRILSEFLDKEAKENPEGLKERLLQIKNYEQLKKRKEELESQVDELFSKEEKQEAINQLKAREKEQVELTEKARWFVGWRGQINLKNWTTIGWLFRSKEETELRRKIWSGKSKWVWVGTPSVFREDFEKKLKEVQEKVQRIESITTQRDYYRLFFKEQRVNFFAGLLGAKKLFDIISQRINERLTFLISEGETKKDLEKLEEARNYFRKVRQIREEPEIMPLFGFPHPEEYESYLAEKIDDVVASLLKEKLSEMKTSNQVLNLVKEIGQADELKPEAKEAIMTALEKNVEESGKKIEKPEEARVEEAKLAETAERPAEKPKERPRAEKPKRKRAAKTKTGRKEVGISIRELPQEKLSELLKMVLEKGLLITVEEARAKIRVQAQP